MNIYMTLAMSVDGYIATKDGGFDWLVGDGVNEVEGGNEWNYERFLDGVDVVVMGKRCYEQGFHRDYATKRVYVATKETRADEGNVRFIAGDLLDQLRTKEAGSNVFLFGGGELIAQFVQRNAIDRYIIGVAPIILGEGRPLFHGGHLPVELKLIDYSVQDGFTVMTYERR